MGNEIMGDVVNIPMGASFSDVPLNCILMKDENLSQLKSLSTDKQAVSWQLSQLPLQNRYFI